MARGLDYEHVNCPLWSFEGAAKPAHIDKLSAVIAVGKHLFPFRTEKLSPPAPMVLGGQPPGRVGRRRTNVERAGSAGSFSFRWHWGRGDALSGPELLAPVGIEVTQPAHALAHRRVSDEQRRESLLREGVEGVERLGCRVGAELHQLGCLLEPDQRIREPVR